MSYKHQNRLISLAGLQLRTDSSTAYQPLLVKTKSTLTSRPSSSQTSRRHRKLEDIFERDPFKVQSYKFHYAERPTVLYPNPTKGQNHPAGIFNDSLYTLAASRLSSGSKSRKSFSDNCRAFFYNHGFADSGSTAENPSLSSVQRSRRRKFVQAQISGAPGNVLGSPRGAHFDRHDASSTASHYAGSGRRVPGGGSRSNQLTACSSAGSAKSQARPLGSHGAGYAGSHANLSTITSRCEKGEPETKRGARYCGSIASIASAPSALTRHSRRNSKHGPAEAAAQQTINLDATPAVEGTVEAPRTPSVASRKSSMSLRSLAPNCQININIHKPARDHSVSININAQDDEVSVSPQASSHMSLGQLHDVQLNDLSRVAPTPRPTQVPDNTNVDARNSNCSFSVDKRLSKFDLLEAEEKKQQREREREWARQHALQMRDRREAVAIIGGPHHISTQIRGSSRDPLEGKASYQNFTSREKSKEASSIRARRLLNTQSMSLRGPLNLRNTIEVRPAPVSRVRPRTDSQSSRGSWETKFLNTNRSLPVVNSKRAYSPSRVPLNGISEHCSRQRSVQSLYSNKENFAFERNSSNTSFASRGMPIRRDGSNASTRSSATGRVCSSQKVQRPSNTSLERPFNLNIRWHK